MKKAFQIIFIFIIIVSIYNFYQYVIEVKEEKERIAQRKKEIEAMRQQEEQSRSLLHEEENGLPDAFPPESPTPVSDAPRNVKTPTPRTTVNHRHEIMAICQKRRCSLLKYNEQGHSIYIEVAGQDHSAVSEILSDLIEAGVVNFTEHREKFGVKMVNGKRIYSAAYTLRW